MILVLEGFNGIEGDLRNEFTVTEKATAMGIAELWNVKGWKPVLYSKTYDGRFHTIYNYKSRQRKAA